MQNLFTFLLIIHIAGGMIGLLAGTLNIMLPKGGKRHRQFGNIFAFSMLSAGFSALGLSVIHPNSFLLIVGLFTIYQVGTGMRMIKRVQHQQVVAIDWMLSGGMALAELYFIFLGVYLLMHGNLFGLTPLVFALIGFSMLKTDFKLYRGIDVPGFNPIKVHLQRMTGAFIASLTAFLVVNASNLPAFVPAVVYWLLPTALLTPLIFKWSGKYTVKA